MAQCDAAGVNGSNRIIFHGAPPGRVMPNGCLGSPVLVLPPALTKASSWMSDCGALRLLAWSLRSIRPKQVGVASKGRADPGGTFEFTRSRKRAKPTVASRVQRRVRPHGCSLSEVHGNEESRCRKDLLVRIGLRPRRSALGVVPELAEFLRAAAGFGDLRGPLDGGCARREFQDTEAAVELLGLRVGLVRDGAVGGDHQRRDVRVDTTAEHIDAGILRLAYDRVCRVAAGAPLC